MKKLFAKLLLLVLPIAGILFILNQFYIKSNYWKAKDDIYKFNFVPDKIELANVGSSHGQVNLFYADFPEYITFNFGLPAQDHSHSYALLKQFLSHVNKNAVVLIPISYFEIVRRSPADEVKIRRVRYYRFLKRKYMKEADDWKLLEYILYSAVPVLTAKENMLKLYKSPFDIPAEKINIFDGKIIHHTEDELKEYARKKYEYWTDPQYEKGEEGFSYNFNAACKLIDFCKEHSLIPVLYTAPITDILNAYFDRADGFFDTFYRFIDELQKKYPDIKYFDYSHNADFSPNHEIFLDSDHLNRDGAKLFTARIIQDLREAKLLEQALVSGGR